MQNADFTDLLTCYLRLTASSECQKGDFTINGFLLVSLNSASVRGKERELIVPFFFLFTFARFNFVGLAL